MMVCFFLPGPHCLLLNESPPPVKFGGLTSSPSLADGCRLRGKGGDFCDQTIMSERKNVGGRIDIAIMGKVNPLVKKNLHQV